MRPASDSQWELLNRLATQLGVGTPVVKNADEASAQISRLQAMRG